ncbi:MAG: PDZ domain-containing protein [Verrucomicrobia bacterium]|nr:PDZ domain-containing protein [Verrucomicrobiota bacterium]MBU4290798.1 PDZ domain-containing protein [Verrucomicrobiota bacterium]MBU4430394.1 PDZ domain-containing protein [Verrucomicrobiota bacterium]MCG2681249.1 PDZ domain-containing protein [Kiritimatiellia bacterium]
MTTSRNFFKSVITGAIVLALGASQANAQVKTSTIRIGTNSTANVITITLPNGRPDITNAFSEVEIQSIIQAFTGAGNCTSDVFSSNMDSIVTTISGIVGVEPSNIAGMIAVPVGCEGSISAARSGDNLQQLINNHMSGLHDGVALSGTAEVVPVPVTWFGVAIEPVSEDLQAQLSLPAGAGLIVRHVFKDSPAEKAGVQIQDILVKIDDELLVSEDQLRTLVRNKSEGDMINLTVLRKGQEARMTAQLMKKELVHHKIDGKQLIYLGSFNLDLSEISGQLGTNIRPIVIRKVFSGCAGSGNTNNGKAMDDAARQVKEQINPQLPDKDK